VASEVGIDPAYLRRAAAEPETGSGSGPWERLLGAPTAFVLERTIPGEFPASRFEELVPLMQVATVGQGTASSVGKTLTWSSRSDTNTSSQQILITARDGETLIRIEERLAGFAGGLFGGLVGGGGVGVGIGVGGALAGTLIPVAFAIAFPVAIIGVSYGAARGFFAAHVRKRRARMQDLMDQLVEQVGRDVAERSLSSSPPSSP
jgi:hypothetical protein